MPMTCRSQTFQDRSISKEPWPFCLSRFSILETVAGYLVHRKPTHILRFDFGLAFAQRMLDIFILPAFVIPQTLDQVVKGLLEPISEVCGQPSSFGISSEMVPTSCSFLARGGR